MRLFPWVAFLPVALALTACSEAPSSARPGSLFVATEKAPSSQTQIYVYWPAEENGWWQDLWVHSCDGVMGELQPGGYARFLVEPGQQCFKAQKSWNLDAIGSTAGAELASLDLDVAAGQTLFVRLEKRPGLVFSGMALRSVEPARAEPEIKRCGKMIPLTEEEMLQAWKAASND